jgi:hypothetical protein
MKVTSPRVASGPSDEHTLVIPDAWRRVMHPRRGGVLPPGPAPEPVITSLLDTPEGRKELERVLTGGGSDGELVERGLAYLGGAADPLGAAVAAVLAVPDHLAENAFGRIVEGWAAGPGVAFAACAFAEMSGIRVEPRLNAKPAVGRLTDADRRFHRPWLHGEVGRRIRTLLATTGEAEYRDAVERLAALRRTPAQRVTVAYLAPGRRDWVDELCASGDVTDPESWMLYCSLGSPGQLDRVREWLPFHWYHGALEVMATLVEGVGAAVVPLIDGALNELGAHADAPHLRDLHRSLLDVLAWLPCDDAFRVLLRHLDEPHARPAVQGAMGRFPVRATRLLPQAAQRAGKKAAIAGDLLRAHLVAHPEAVEAVLPELSPSARAAVESARAATVRVPDAPAEALPPLLVAPPWTRPRARRRTVVVEGLVPPAARSVRWLPGERDRWAASVGRLRPGKEIDWAAEADAFRRGRLRLDRVHDLFVSGPADLVRPLLESWAIDEFSDPAEPARGVVARFEADALRPALLAAERNPARGGDVLLPLLSTETALTAARWLARLKSARRFALAWLDRHGLAAVPHLVPAALGKAAAERSEATAALRVLAARHGLAEVVAAATAAYGDEAAGAVEATLAVDPLELLPSRIPEIAHWADPAALPQALLRDRAHALPAAAVRHLLTMLAISKPGDVYAGVEAVRELCDPASLAEFGWGVFQSWLAAGAPSKDGWALAQLGWLGDDETVRRLTPLIRSWPGEGLTARAVSGLDVLADIGSHAALTHLSGIALKVRFKALRERAQRKIEEVAAGRGLTAEQLADRLVPDLGLDPEGRMVLDYGPRRFVVGFDERLRPYVTDEGGRRRAAPPKPGAADDPEAALDAHRRFAELKKHARTVAADQIHRLEAAMVTRRRWPAREFRELFVAHPLLCHITRRLVWLAEDGDAVTAFRVAEDRTFAGAGGEALTLPDTARVGIAHPLDLAGSLTVWSALFARHAIPQPFPQLGRAVHTLTEQERGASSLTRFEGVTVPAGKVVGLERRGWRRCDPLDGGWQGWLYRQVAADRYVIVDLDPGLVVGDVNANPEQELAAVVISSRPDVYWHEHDTSAVFGDLAPVMASEVLADLTELTADTS